MNTDGLKEYIDFSKTYTVTLGKEIPDNVISRFKKLIAHAVNYRTIDDFVDPTKLPSGAIGMLENVIFVREAA